MFRLLFVALAGLIVGSIAAGCSQSPPSPNLTPYRFANHAQAQQWLHSQEQERINQEAALRIASIRNDSLPPDHRRQIDNRFGAILRDPESRRVEFGNNPFGGLQCGTVNAKNAYGGYTGRQPFAAYFTDGRLVDLLVGSEAPLDQHISAPTLPTAIKHRLLAACGRA